MNVYHNNHEESMDSAVSSGESSRRNSNPFAEFKEFVRRRRSSGRVTSKYQQLANSMPDEFEERKVSIDSQFFELDESDEERDNNSLLMASEKRRLSAPDKFLVNKDYAILRQSRERQLEVVAAFDRHTDPYRKYMQSLFCYDLAPTHGTALLIDGNLLMRKSMMALYQSGHDAALVINLHNQKPIGIITVTDCLQAIAIASRVDREVGDRPVKDFIKLYGKKKLVTTNSNMSVWDAARLFCLNRVHRIPVFQVDDASNYTDLLYTLSLRKIFYATILRLIEPSYLLAPHVKIRTLIETGIGNWNSIPKVSVESNCGQLIELFISSKISCFAVVNEFDKVVGKVNKNDIVRELSEHCTCYLDIINVPIKKVYRTPPYASATNTIYEGIALLLSSDDQCIFVIDCNQRLVASISFIDFMDYILKSDEIHHKMSVA